MNKEKRIEAIMYVTKFVAEYFGFNQLQFICKTKNRDIIRKRQIAQELCYSLIPNVTLKEIGENIGHIGHDTIRYSIITVRGLYSIDKDYNSDYVYLSKRLKSYIKPLRLSKDIRDKLNYSRNLKSSRLAAKRHNISYNLNYSF